jgi:hypothetical protein
MHNNQDFCNPITQQEVFDLIESIYFIDFSNKGNLESNEIINNDIYKLNKKIWTSYLSDYTDVADFELKVL